MFGRKRSSKNSCACQLANYQEQTGCKENSCYQVIPGDMLVHAGPDKSSKDLRRPAEPQSKSPSYKLPRAVLLSRAMVEKFPEVIKRHSVIFSRPFFQIRESYLF